MKRSDINVILREGEAFFRSLRFELPPFAYWSAEEMLSCRNDLSSLADAGLGWDLTDYGAGHFEELGLLLFTLRNGRTENLSQGRGMLYAEKAMISRKEQISPMHRHVMKTEDIINRGGGKLILELFTSLEDGTIDPESEFAVYCDGISRNLNAGAHLPLDPGESVTLLPGIWHAFWAEGADVMIGEVSTVNDDLNDNIFAEPLDRFSTVEEDAPPERLLVSDYPNWLQ